MKYLTIVVFTICGFFLFFSCSGEKYRETEGKIYYRSTELKFGDYYYTDGTWSDGGLRCLNRDGSIEVADVKPAPIAGKTVLGIVFQTDSERIGAREKDFLYGLGVDSVHGLVLSLVNVGNGQPFFWGGYGLREYVIKEEPSKEESYLDINGLEKNEALWNSRYWEINFEAASTVKKLNAADSLSKEKRTPWFVPSSGQWWDILQNLGGMAVLREQEQRESSIRGSFFWKDQAGICDKLNYWISAIPDSVKDNFNPLYDHFWSASKFNRYRQQYVGMINEGGFVFLDWNSGGNKHKVRCILAF